MKETLPRELLDKTKQALDLEDWDAVERLWQPWVGQGDADAEYTTQHSSFRLNSTKR
jgi:hypothetical protein